MGSISTIEHDVGVNIIKLSQSGGGRQERRIIYVDQKKEMFKVLETEVKEETDIIEDETV